MSSRPGRTTAAPTATTDPEVPARAPHRARRGRHAVVAIAVVAALGLLAACGSSSTASEGSTASTERTSGSSVESGDGGSAYPVSIEHKFGETTIETKPTRVVTVGLTDQDALIALGTVPVGVTEWLETYDGAIGPWATDELGDTAVPEVIGGPQGLNFEAIANLQPDLIVGLYAGLTDADHATLSQIAPTVAQPGDVVDYGISWQDQTRTIGTILGETAAADELVADVEAEFTEVTRANPDFAGSEGIVATIYNDKISIYAAQDGRGRFMSSLGFTQSDEITELANDTFSADVSRERVDLVDADVLVWIVLDVETDKPKFAADPLYAALPVHTGGHDVYVANGSDVGSALSFQSVLSIPFLLEELVPDLAAARAGTPAP
jgi:iron complex transport system substrate-binding protein